MATPRVSREDWKRRVGERHPEIQRLRETIHPWERFKSLVDIFEPGREQIKQQLEHDTTVKIILQHLSFLGFYEARELLVKESGIDCTRMLVSFSRLALTLTPLQLNKMTWKSFKRADYSTLSVTPIAKQSKSTRWL